MHKSVGAIIKRNNKYLLVDRKKYPYGFACPAGHIDKGETSKHALLREIKEETNLKILSYKLLLHEFVPWNKCSRGVQGHDWYVYSCAVKGKIKLKPDEEKSIAWYTLDEIKKLKLEKVWQYWLKKLKIL